MEDDLEAVAQDEEAYGHVAAGRAAVRASGWWLVNQACHGEQRPVGGA